MNELINDKFFSNINGYNLDINQRKIILSKAKNLLVVAGAGSGKTLTIVGKVNYLLKKELVNPSEILCISFTNETVNNLKEKLNNNIDVYTFHKLSLEILKSHKIYYNIASSDALEYVVNEYFESKVFYQKYIKYILRYLYFYIDKNNKEFNSIAFDNIKKEYNSLFISYKKLIIKFINLIKCNNHNISDFNKYLKCNKYLLSKTKKFKNKCFFIVMFDIYKIYLEELNSTYSIDFDMMINVASLIIKKYGMKRFYKYIIIDEWQDTSICRYELIKNISIECNSNVFCVGDDFQSIYKFSGCTMDLFVNFKKYFEDSKVLYMRNTYRNSKELIKISYNFIIKNHYQLSKRLNSHRNLDKPIKIIYYTKSNYEFIFYKLLNKLHKENKLNILVLGRCNHDINMVYHQSIKDGKIEYLNMNIKYLTVHKSKGLESDNVIVLNLSSNILGFPNKIEDDEVLKLFFKNKEKYKYAEERRLFYVALTRTRNYVYLMVQKNQESIFVKEIINKCEIIDL